MQVADAFLIFKSKESQRQVSMAQQQTSLDHLAWYWILDSFCIILIFKSTYLFARSLQLRACVLYIYNDDTHTKSSLRTILILNI